MQKRLTSRRFRWMQKLVKEHTNYSADLTALFAHFKFEENPTIDPESGQLACDSDGRSLSNPCAQAFWSDWMQPAEHEAAQYFVSQLRGPLRIFEPVLAEEFIQIDLSEMRSRQRIMNVAPVGTAMSKSAFAETCVEDLGWCLPVQGCKRYFMCKRAVLAH